MQKYGAKSSLVFIFVKLPITSLQSGSLYSADGGSISPPLTNKGESMRKRKKIQEKQLQ